MTGGQERNGLIRVINQIAHETQMIHVLREAGDYVRRWIYFSRTKQGGSGSALSLDMSVWCFD